MDLIALKFAQELIDPLRFRHEEHRMEQISKLRLGLRMAAVG
jgi:hypothetical protein